MKSRIYIYFFSVKMEFTLQLLLENYVLDSKGKNKMNEDDSQKSI